MLKRYLYKIFFWILLSNFNKTSRITKLTIYLMGDINNVIKDSSKKNIKLSVTTWI